MTVLRNFMQKYAMAEAVFAADEIVECSYKNEIIVLTNIRAFVSPHTTDAFSR